MKRRYRLPLARVRRSCQMTRPALSTVHNEEVRDQAMRVLLTFSLTDLPQRTTTMIDPVNTPETPAPAIARPMIRAVLLCAVAHTRDLGVKDQRSWRFPILSNSPEFENAYGDEEDCFDLQRVSARKA